MLDPGHSCYYHCHGKCIEIHFLHVFALLKNVFPTLQKTRACIHDRKHFAAGWSAQLPPFTQYFSSRIYDLLVWHISRTISRTTDLQVATNFSLCIPPICCLNLTRTLAAAGGGGFLLTDCYSHSFTRCSDGEERKI